MIKITGEEMEAIIQATKAFDKKGLKMKSWLANKVDNGEGTKGAVDSNNFYILGETEKAYKIGDLGQDKDGDPEIISYTFIPKSQLISNKVEEEVKNTNEIVKNDDKEVKKEIVSLLKENGVKASGNMNITYTLLPKIIENGLESKLSELHLKIEDRRYGNVFVKVA